MKLKNLLKPFHRLIHNIKILLIVITLLVYSQGYTQAIFHIYKDDFQKYCKSTFYLSSDNLKDSLPDGTYIFFNVFKIDSSSSNKKIELKGTYINGKKDGIFENYHYRNLTKRTYECIAIHTTQFSNGLKSGIDEYSKVFELNGLINYVPQYFNIYVNDEKNGICINYLEGKISSILLYKNNQIIERYFGDEIDGTLLKSYEIPDGRR